MDLQYIVVHYSSAKAFYLRKTGLKKFLAGFHPIHAGIILNMG